MRHPHPQEDGEAGVPDRVSATFESLLEAAPDAMVGVDQAGTIRFVNRQTETLFRYDRTALVGLPVETLVPESFRHVHPTHRKEYFADPRTRSMGAGLNLSGRRRDGTQFPVDISLSSIDTEDGLLVTAAVRDITERQAASQEVARMAAILGYSNDAIIGKTLGGIITTWNPAAERLYGYTSAEAVGMPVSLLVPLGQVDDIAEILARVSRGERIEHYETRRTGKDGRVLDVSLSVAPIRDPHGTLVGASTITRDITEGKRAQESARAAAERFESVFESAPAGTAVIGLDGQLLQVNGALCELLGRTEQALLTGTMASLTHPLDRSKTSEAFARLLSGKPRSKPVEERFVRARGQIIWAW